MKIIFAIIAATLLVGCSASHENKIKLQKPTQLSCEQAKLLSLKLANDKLGRVVFTTYTGSNLAFITWTQTNFSNGHWIFKFSHSEPHDNYYATVELASDGSTNYVTAWCHGGMP